MLKKIKYIFVFILINSLVFNAFAQNQKDTALIRKLINLSKLAKSEKDNLKMFTSANKAVKFSHKINNKLYIAYSYFNLALCFYSIDSYNKSIKNYDKAIAYYKKTNSNYGLSKSFYGKANACYHLHNLDSSLHFHLIAFKYSEKSKDKSLLASSTNAVGLSYWRKGRNIEALDYYKKSLAVRKDIGDVKGVSLVLNSLGAVYDRLGHYNAAHSYYLEALKIVDSLQLNRKYVLIKNNIGLIFQEWEQYSTALKHHLSAIERCKTIDYNFGLAYSEINAGICYQNLHKNYKAKEKFKNALIHYKKTRNLLANSYANRVVGNFYLETKKIEKALEHYSIAYEKSKEIGSESHKAYSLKAIATAYLELRNYKLAEKYTFLSLKISLNENYKTLIKDNYFILSKIKEQNNDFKQALVYHKKASLIKDTISRRMLKNNILDLQERYDTEKKEKENILLVREKINNETSLKEKNNIIIISTISLVLLIIYAFIVSVSRKLLKNENKLLAIKSSTNGLTKTELENNTISKTKVNSYTDKITSIILNEIKTPVKITKELLNLLVNKNIKGKELDAILVILKDKANATSGIVNDLFKWVNVKNATIPFEPNNIDISILIEDIIKLSNSLADNKSIEITNKIEEPTIVFADRKMLAIVLRNLISNSIKFTQNNGKIIIEALDNKDNVAISVKDNGTGIKKEIIKKILLKNEFYSTPGTNEEQGYGLGLKLCVEFLKTNKSKLFIESEPEKGSTFTFSLPKTG